jgi:hypothetical protein
MLNTFLNGTIFVSVTKEDLHVSKALNFNIIRLNESIRLQKQSTYLIFKFYYILYIYFLSISVLIFHCFFASPVCVYEKTQNDLQNIFHCSHFLGKSSSSV